MYPGQHCKQHREFEGLAQVEREVEEVVLCEHHSRGVMVPAQQYGARNRTVQHQLPNCKGGQYAVVSISVKMVSNSTVCLVMNLCCSQGHVCSAV
jgi:hypothetical protein